MTRKLHIIKSNPPKPKKATMRVQIAIKRAIAKANEHEWTRVIIIGQSKERGAWMYSPMDEEVAIGMLEKAKLHILSEPENY